MALIIRSGSRSQGADSGNGMKLMPFSVAHETVGEYLTRLNTPGILYCFYFRHVFRIHIIFIPECRPFVRGETNTLQSRRSSQFKTTRWSFATTLLTAERFKGQNVTKKLIDEPVLFVNVLCIVSTLQPQTNSQPQLSTFWFFMNHGWARVLS